MSQLGHFVACISNFDALLKFYQWHNAMHHSLTNHTRGNMTKYSTLISTSAIALAMLATPAFAQIDEVIVTSTKRQTTLQDTPVAVTVTSADTIEKAQILDILDLQSVVPSLRVSQLQNSVQTNFIIQFIGISTL